MPKSIEKKRKKRRKNSTFSNLKYYGGVQREKRITATDQLSELRDISSEKQLASPLDTGFLVSDSESILHFETQNDHNISNFNEQSNNFPSFQNFDSSNNFSVSHDVELENFDNNLYNSDFENVSFNSEDNLVRLSG